MLNSPGGTAEGSLGRKPQESGVRGTKAPEGRQTVGRPRFVRPSGAGGTFPFRKPWGFRPRLPTGAASRLECETSKLAQSVLKLRCFNSPGGTAEGSPGAEAPGKRCPWDQSPGGAADRRPSAFRSPLRGWRGRFRSKTWGFRPGYLLAPLRGWNAQLQNWRVRASVGRPWAMDGAAFQDRRRDAPVGLPLARLQ